MAKGVDFLGAAVYGVISVWGLRENLRSVMLEQLQPHPKNRPLLINFGAGLRNLGAQNEAQLQPGLQMEALFLVGPNCQGLTDATRSLEPDRSTAWPSPRARPAPSPSTPPSESAALRVRGTPSPSTPLSEAGTRRRRGGPSACLSLTRWSSPAPGLRAVRGRRWRAPPAAALCQEVPGAHSIPVQVRAVTSLDCKQQWFPR
jgi:hypothetical protein